MCPSDGSKLEMFYRPNNYPMSLRCINPARVKGCAPYGRADYSTTCRGGRPAHLSPWHAIRGHGVFRGETASTSCFPPIGVVRPESLRLLLQCLRRCRPDLLQLLPFSFRKGLSSALWRYCSGSSSPPSAGEMARAARGEGYLTGETTAAARSPCLIEQISCVAVGVFRAQG